MRGEFVDLDGCRLYYYAAGTRGAGEPVLFLHGFPTSAHLWSEVVPLVPGGHRVVVVDLLGFGRSDPPGGRDLSIAGHGRRILALLDALRIGFACAVGHDIGGGIAQWLAVHAPTRISRLGLIDSVAFDGWPPREVRLARAMSPLTRHLPPQWLLSIVRSDLARGYAAPDRAARSIDRFLRPFASADGRDALMQHLTALECTETVKLAERLGSLVQPTAIVWGAGDVFLPVALGERLRDLIPGASLDILPDTGHFAPEEAPEAVGRAIASLLER